MKTYKHITVGHVYEVEETANQYAAEGWRVVSMQYVYELNLANMLNVVQVDLLLEKDGEPECDIPQYYTPIR